MPPSPAYGNAGRGSLLSAYSFLIGSERFWQRAAEDMKRARSRLLVQAMTFEGDAAGQKVAEAISGSRAADRRVLVDDYTRAVVSDHFVLSPHYLLSRAFRDEVRATRRMFRGLIRDGVRVRTTNPIAGRVARYGVRNHKKLIVADDVAYIGGLNFSDHNFDWHDIMLRIEAPDAAAFLAEDFDATWESRSEFRQADFGDVTLLALDGRTNREGFGPLMAAIEGARERIEIVSPYLSFPFVEALGAAVRRGIRVELLTPLPNNKPMVRHYLSHAAPRAGLEMLLLPEMTHLKAMLIDGRTNREGFGPLMAAIEGARERIEIVSPYLSFPFVEALGTAVRRGIRVELLTPLPNNKPMVRHYLSHAAPRAGLEMLLLPEMTHLKAMLIDGRRLVLGSSNFDFPSYYAFEEYIALVDDPELVAAFRTQVLQPLRTSVIPGAVLRSAPWHVLRSRIILALGGLTCRAMGGMERRAIDWRG